MYSSTAIHDWNSLAALVKESRVDRGWTQGELADRARVSRAWIAKVERGHRGAELEHILRLFQALSIDLVASSPRLDERAHARREERSPAAAVGDAVTRTRDTAVQRRREAWAHARTQGPADAGAAECKTATAMNST